MIEFTPVACWHTRSTHASRRGTTYFRRSRDSLFPVADASFATAANATCSISLNSSSACSLLRERSNAAYASFFFPRLNSQRGDSDRKKLPKTNRTPGGSDIQKMRLHASFLNINNAAALAVFPTIETR